MGRTLAYASSYQVKKISNVIPRFYVSVLVNSAEQSIFYQAERVHMEKFFVYTLDVAFATYVRRPFLVYSQPTFRNRERFKSLVALVYKGRSDHLRGFTVYCRVFCRDFRIH